MTTLIISTDGKTTQIDAFDGIDLMSFSKRLAELAASGCSYYALTCTNPQAVGLNLSDSAPLHHPEGI